MVSRTVHILTGLAGLVTIAVFTIGLAKSIIDGFAGFKGGLPFAIIVAFVLSLVLYDFYDSCLRKKDK